MIFVIFLFSGVTPRPSVSGRYRAPRNLCLSLGLSFAEMQMLYRCDYTLRGKKQRTNPLGVHCFIMDHSEQDELT